MSTSVRDKYYRYPFKSEEARMRRIELHILLIIFLAGAVFPLHAQELRSYYITCDQEDFDFIIANPFEDIYIDCTFEYNDSIWTGTRIRIRGESSREYPKKSFKVNFDADQRFFGRDKVNLASEWTDPSFCREYLSYDLFQRAGLTASQTWFARLYVNGAYMGLYLDVEQVDEIFLESRGLPDDASIYKATGYGSMLTINENVEELWEKKTNEDTGNYDLQDFIRWLDNVPAGDFQEGLSTRFSIDYLARVFAVNSLTGNQSTYYHNYYMIHELEKDGIWHFVPWDMDKTFIYWSGYSSPHYYRSGHQLLEDINPLTAKCWQNDSIRTLIFENIQGISDSLFTPEYYYDLTVELEDLLFEAVSEDTMKQYSTEDFISTLNAIPYQVENRVFILQQQMSAAPMPFDIQSGEVTPNGIYFIWDSTFTADGSPAVYTLQVSPDKNFSNIVYELSGISGANTVLDQLAEGAYYWRIIAGDGSGNEIYSTSFFHEVAVEYQLQSSIYKSGIISVSERWDSVSAPYSIADDLIIAENCTLTIDPGVDIYINANKSVIVEGTLIADGTESDSIYFSSLNPDSEFAGFMIAADGEMILKYTILSGGTGLEADAVNSKFIIINNGKLTIEDSGFRKVKEGVVYADSAETYIESVDFTDIPANTVFISKGNFSLNNSSFSRCSTADDAYDIITVNNIDNGLEISRCEFWGGVDDAIAFNQVSGGYVERNLIEFANDKGIYYASGSEGTYFSNNIIRYCDEGASILDSSNAVFYNNVITFNQTGISFKDNTSSAGCKIRNTVLSNNDTDVDYTSPVIIDIGFCLVENEDEITGPGILSGNPDFIDQWNGNYYLQENSPLIDAGYGYNYPLLDYNDTVRIDIPGIANTGSGAVDYVDIGIYEFIDTDSSLQEPVVTLPENFDFLNYPNPFNSSTQIKFTVVNGNWAKLRIYNILGQKVYEQDFNDIDPGNISLHWNGRNSEGRFLASGIYFCQLEQQAHKTIMKMLILK